MQKKKEIQEVPTAELPLCVIAGTDVRACDTRVHEYEKQYRERGYKRIIHSITFSEEIGNLEAEIFGRDLFISHKVIVIVGALEYDATRGILQRLITHTNYPHVLIFRETNVSVDMKKFLTKIGHAPELYDLAELPPPSVFRLCDAWGSGDMKRTWLTYHELLDAGVSTHQMIGTLWWQLSTTLLVMRSASNPGLKPFVYTKAQKILTLYTPERLWQQAHSLISVYHKGHNGSNIDTLFERFLLGEKM